PVSNSDATGPIPRSRLVRAARGDVANLLAGYRDWRRGADLTCGWKPPLVTFAAITTSLPQRIRGRSIRSKTMDWTARAIAGAWDPGRSFPTRAVRDGSRSVFDRVRGAARCHAQAQTLVVLRSEFVLVWHRRDRCGPPCRRPRALPSSRIAPRPCARAP